MSGAEPTGTDWREVLNRKLALFGHRNWIVIADAAYPAQSAAGVTTILSNADHLDVVKTVLKAIESAAHVKARIRVDGELMYVNERDAPGVEEYRATLGQMLRAENLEHEEIIDRLNAAATKFEVLVIKTRFTIPYTTVFLELDCGYWTADSEARLRATMDS